MFFVCLLELSFQRTPPEPPAPPTAHIHIQLLIQRTECECESEYECRVLCVCVCVCVHGRECAFIRTPECLPFRIALHMYWCCCVRVSVYVVLFCSVLHISVFTSRFVYFARKQVHTDTHIQGNTQGRPQFAGKNQLKFNARSQDISSKKYVFHFEWQSAAPSRQFNLSNLNFN